MQGLKAVRWTNKGEILMVGEQVKIGSKTFAVETVGELRSLEYDEAHGRMLLVDSTNTLSVINTMTSDIQTKSNVCSATFCKEYIIVASSESNTLKWIDSSMQTKTSKSFEGETFEDGLNSVQYFDSCSTLFLFSNDIDAYVSLIQVSSNGLELEEPRIESYDNFVPSDVMIDDR